MPHLFERLRRFFEELKRRRVYRVAAVYAVVSWVVVQIAATSLPYLMDHPDWLVRAVIVLALVGFPVTLVLGWIFDLTPEGVQRTDAPPGPEPSADRAPGAVPDSKARAVSGARSERAGVSGPRVAVLASLLVVAVTVGFALWYVRTRVGGGPHRPPVRMEQSPVSDDGAPSGFSGMATPPAGARAPAGPPALPSQAPARKTPPRVDTAGAAGGGAGGGREQAARRRRSPEDTGLLPAATPRPTDVDSILRQIGAAVSGLQAGGIAQAEGRLPAHMHHTAVLPFRVTGINADAKWSGLVADSLSATLRAAGYATVNSDTVQRAVDQGGPDDGGRSASAALARRLGADAFITGVVVPQGTSLVLEIMLSSTDEPDIIRHATAIVPISGLNEALERVVRRLTAAHDTAAR